MVKNDVPSIVKPKSKVPKSRPKGQDLFWYKSANSKSGSEWPPWLIQPKKLTRWTVRSRIWGRPTCSRNSLSINPNFWKESSWVPRMMPLIQPKILICQFYTSQFCPKSNLIKDKIPVLAHELTSYVNTMILIGNLDLGHIIDTLNYFATPTPKLLVLVSLDLDSGLTIQELSYKVDSRFNNVLFLFDPGQV